MYYYPAYLSKKCCATCEHCLVSRELTHPVFGEPKVQINGDPAGCAADKTISYRGTTPNPTDWKCRKWERCSLVELYFEKKKENHDEQTVISNSDAQVEMGSSTPASRLFRKSATGAKEPHPKGILISGIIVSALGFVQFGFNLAGIIISKGIEAKIDTNTTSGAHELAKEEQNDIILWVMGAIGAVVLMVGAVLLIDYARLKKKK
jgi:hypothetical protein